MAIVHYSHCGDMEIKILPRPRSVELQRPAQPIEVLDGIRERRRFAIHSPDAFGVDLYTHKGGRDRGRRWRRIAIDLGDQVLAMRRSKPSASLIGQSAVALVHGDS
jgi:hypothetical protein